MGNTGLGIQKIEMYIQMVENKFAPLLNELQSRMSIEKFNAEIEVRKEFGIYDLTVKRSKLQMELDEIERQLKSFEKTTRKTIPGVGTRWVSPIDDAVDAKLQQRKHQVYKEVEWAVEKIKDSIRLAGASDDVQRVFKSLDDTVTKLSAKVSKLPKVKMQNAKYIQ